MDTNDIVPGTSVADRLDADGEHSKYFSTPCSEAAQSYFQSVLEGLAKRAFLEDRVAGVHKFLCAVRDEFSRSQMITWLDDYSMIGVVIAKGGHKQYHIVRSKADKAAFWDGVKNPYYKLTPKPQKYYVKMATAKQWSLVNESEQTQIAYENPFFCPVVPAASGVRSPRVVARSDPQWAGWGRLDCTQVFV